ncbi:MAG: outer membrane beta-barrel protein, partial [Bacteroidota bacterium]
MIRLTDKIELNYIRVLIIMTLISLTSLYTFNTYGQDVYSISGRVIDVNREPLAYANIACYNAEDSTFVTGTLPGADGNFNIKYMRQGSYLIKISYVGYLEWQSEVKVEDKDVHVGAIILPEDLVELSAITVEGTRERVVIKGDTIEYNAAAYKTNPDATVGALVKKMPGITVENGKVQAEGEDVRRVTIDGEDYFGNDVMLAMTNLPAEFVSKVQIIDGQSDQSRLTGIIDPVTIKTINIITKNPDSKIVFGKIRSGYGTDERYNSGGNINFFDAKERISLIGSFNNINQQNFSSQDLIGTSGIGSQGGGMRGRPSGAGPSSGQSGNDFFVENQQGINTTNAIGLNYNNKWGDKISVNASYFYNQTLNQNINYLTRNYFTTDSSSLSYNEESTQNSNNQNHRFNLKLEYNINPYNTIIFKPNVSYQVNLPEGVISGWYQNNLEEPYNGTVTLSEGDLTGLSINGDLLFIHRFVKPGRTFSINLKNEQTIKATEDYREFLAYDFDPDSISVEPDQKNTLDYNSTRRSASLNFTEQLKNGANLVVKYTPSYEQSVNDIRTNILDSISNDYSKLDSSLTSNLNTFILTQNAGISYQYRFGKSMFNIGAAYQNNRLKGEYIFPEQERIDKTYHSILPTIMFMHRFSDSKSLVLFYRPVNNLPSAGQLQEVVDNSNPLQLTFGNSELEQEYSHSLAGRFSSTNSEDNTFFSAFMMLQFTKDYIGTSTYIARNDTININGIMLAPGTQLNSYTNFNNYINLRTFFTYGVPITFIKSNLNLTGKITYRRNPGTVNEI